MLLFTLMAVFFGVKTDKKITIVFTNDILGSLQPGKAYFVSKEMPPEIGNMKSLQVMVERERKKGEILLLNSGNLAPFNLPGKKKSAEELADFLEKLGYDASLIGTNELSYGMDFLSELISGTKTKFLSVNLKGNYIPFTVREVNGLKIGILGITSPYARLFVPTRFRKNVKVDVAHEEAVGSTLERLKEKDVDLVVALSDAGRMTDSTIAENFKGIDFIIGSSNRGRVLREPYETPSNHTLLCKAYSNLTSAGRLVLYLDKQDCISGYEYELITLFTDRYPPVNE